MTTEKWEAPADLDREVLELCRAMNAFPGITTVESCSGHGNRPFRIWFMAENLDALPGLLYWFDACHTGQHGWSVKASTDCAASILTFTAEGPESGYASADAIAKAMTEALAAEVQISVMSGQEAGLQRLRRQVGETGEAVTEYAQLDGNGVFLVWDVSPETEQRRPLAKRIETARKFGGIIFRRRVIVAEDWKEVTEP